MRLPLLTASILALATLPAAAQQGAIEDDGTLRIHPRGEGTELRQEVGVLCTEFNSDNGFQGNMFDLQPAVNLEIYRLDLNVDGAGLPVTMDLWYAPSSSFGIETDVHAWTFLGTYTGTSAGTDLPTSIDVRGNGVQFLAGQTYALYVDVTSYSTGTSINYTNGDTQGNASGNDEWSNADLKLVANCGKGTGGVAGSTFFSRNWNGCVHYETESLRISSSRLEGGVVASFGIENAAPHSLVQLAYSFTGGGPTQTALGVVDLTPPFLFASAVTVDAQGRASFRRLVPAAWSGRTLWAQAVNFVGPARAEFSNQLAQVVL
ncbi:MAG: hypothetical protein CMJ94_01570 [Planctomycetes bacterium]|nr:hypothetical protein [Planctomycetota bacterium]